MARYILKQYQLVSLGSILGVTKYCKIALEVFVGNSKITNRFKQMINIAFIAVIFMSFDFKVNAIFRKIT